MNDLAKLNELLPGWTESAPGQLLCNPAPGGGIIDKVMTAFLKGTYRFESSATADLGVYHAAKASIYAMRRIGNDRQVAAVKKALKPLAVMVSPGSEPDTVRIFRPDTKGEFIL